MVLSARLNWSPVFDPNDSDAMEVNTERSLVGIGSVVQGGSTTRFAEKSTLNIISAWLEP